MEELEMELQTILDAALFNFGIKSFPNDDELEKDGEYIVYDVRSEEYTEYANNEPVLKEQRVDINHYYFKNGYNSSHTKALKKAMHNANFKLEDSFNDFILDKSIKNIKYEFSRTVTV